MQDSVRDRLRWPKAKNRSARLSPHLSAAGFARDAFGPKLPLKREAATVRFCSEQMRKCGIVKPIDFILEIMDMHPEAFASDECFRYSARYLSGRF